MIKAKKVIALGLLMCSWSALGAAQGLVGAPVDPRYGATRPVAQPNRVASGTAVARALLQAALTALRPVLL